MQKKSLCLLLSALLLISFTTSQPIDEESVGIENTMAYFVSNSGLLTASTKELYEAVKLLDEDSASLFNARKKLASARLDFKRIEFFTEYFFQSETRMYNAAPVTEIEEPTLELVEPMGLQQIESLLFDADVLGNKKMLLLQAEALYSSVSNLKSLLYQFQITDAQILESQRIEIIRIMALSIAGYDAPSLKTGINETLEATKTMYFILNPYMAKEPVSGRRIKHILTGSIQFLNASKDFDSFDRMEYLVKFALPLQKELGVLTRALQLEINTTTLLNYEAEHILKPNAFKKNGFGTTFTENAEMESLGKKLFSEKKLSGTLTTSCATCHQPGNYFNDNLPKSPSLHKDSILKRNTPTLLYAGKQHMQFWDGRSQSLKDQIINVLFNPLEMAGNSTMLNKGIPKDATYQPLFQLAFPEKKTDHIGVDEIATAIASYVNSLAPMSSAFDRYIAGDQKALTDDQISGFNLFMGKAQCGTCHFLPHFNSLLPPFYNVSEVEVLGTPANDDPDKPVKDDDPGRFDLYRIHFYRGAFKTPTLRNAAKTAPYMHNGAFKTLHSVMEFYNRGGGKGLGLNIKDQTLSASKLNLTPKETDQIILFIDALTDSFAY